MFNTAVGEHVDVVTDVMGSGVCGDPVNDPEPESLDAISIPKHHYDAILRLYKTDPKAYAALLQQATAYLDLLRSLQDARGTGKAPLSRSLSRSRAFLAKTIALYN